MTRRDRWWVIPGEPIWTGEEEGVRWTATLVGDDGEAWDIDLARRGWNSLYGEPTGEFDGEEPFRVRWHHRAGSPDLTGARPPVRPELRAQLKEMLIDRTPTPLDAHGQRVVDILAEHLSQDEWMSGRRLRKALGLTAQRQAAVTGLIPRFVRVRYDDDYSLTLPGLLKSSKVAAAKTLIEKILGLLAQKFEVDPDFRSYNSEDLRSAEEVGLMFARGVVNIARLCDGSGGSDTAFRWDTPRDIEDLIQCRNFADFMALVRRGTEHHREDRPWPTAPSRLGGELPVVLPSGEAVAQDSSQREAVAVATAQVSGEVSPPNRSPDVAEGFMPGKCGPHIGNVSAADMGSTLPDGTPLPTGFTASVMVLFDPDFWRNGAASISFSGLHARLVSDLKEGVEDVDLTAALGELEALGFLLTSSPLQPVNSFLDLPIGMPDYSELGEPFFEATALGRKAARACRARSVPHLAIWLLGPHRIDKQVLLAFRSTSYPERFDAIDGACAATETSDVQLAVGRLTKQNAIVGVDGRPDSFKLTRNGRNMQASARGALDAILRQRESATQTLTGAEAFARHAAARRPLRILHISDLHERTEFAGMPDWRSPILRRDAHERGVVLGQDFQRSLRDLGEVDLVCFTGDVADWGRPEEYAKATDRLQRILAAVRVPPERLFVVPGNHDVDRTRAVASWEGIRNWHKAARSATALGSWLVWGEAPAPGLEPGWRSVLEREEAYWEWTRDFGCPPIQPTDQNPLGYRHTFPPGTWRDIDVPVHIVGLDSAWLCGADDDQGRILLTEAQVLAAVRHGEHALDGYRIGLVHHPLDHLADRPDAWGLLADDGVDLLLHGHQHTPLASSTAVPGASLRTIAAGCLIEGDLGSGWPNGFHLIEVDLASKGLIVNFRKWARDASPKFWAKGSDIYRDAPEGVLVWPPDDTPSPHSGSRRADQAGSQGGTGLEALAGHSLTSPDSEPANEGGYPHSPEYPRIAEALVEHALPDGLPPPSGSAGEVIRRFDIHLDGIDGGARTERDIRSYLRDYRRLPVSDAETQAVLVELLDRHLISTCATPTNTVRSMLLGEQASSNGSDRWYCATPLGRKAATMLMSLMAPTAAHWLLGNDRMREQVALAMPFDSSWSFEQIDAVCCTASTDVVRAVVGDLKSQVLVAQAGDLFRLTEQGKALRDSAADLLMSALSKYRMRQVRQDARATQVGDTPDSLSDNSATRLPETNSSDDEPEAARERLTGDRLVVFYSWQSDRPNSVNRGFIGDALERAAKAVARDGAVDVVVDRDTVGVPGAPDITATIFKKISDSHVFVADVTNVYDDVGRGRPSPNPNVLLELGYAVRNLGWQRIVLVMNTAFGGTEALPFDLRNHRVVVYDLQPGSTKVDARKYLVDRLARELRSMLTSVTAESPAGGNHPDTVHGPGTSERSGAESTPDSRQVSLDDRQSLLVLFVSTGGTCRVPMAKVILEQLLIEKGLGSAVEVQARGLLTHQTEASQEAQTAVLHRFGKALLKGYRPRSVDSEVLQRATLILVMNRELKKSLPSSEARLAPTYGFKEFFGSEGDVADPVSGSLAAYKRCLEELESAIRGGFADLMASLEVAIPAGRDRSSTDAKLRPATSVHPVHFKDFSGEQFERLVLAYHVRVESDTNWEWYGQVGSDLGRDLWGEREDGTTVCVQCVNRAALTFDKGSGDLDKTARGPKGKPTLFRIVCRSAVSADMRDRLKKHAEGLGVTTCEIWSGADFEERLRRDAEPLLNRFFEGEAFPDSLDEPAQPGPQDLAGVQDGREQATESLPLKGSRRHSLIAIGPEVLAEGQIISGQRSRWTVRLDRFLVGDSSALRRFTDDIDTIPLDERYIATAEGNDVDARRVQELVWRRGDHGIVVEVQVAPPVPPMTVRGLKATNLRLRPVEGVDAAVALLQSILGTAWGWSDSRFGTVVGRWLQCPELQGRLEQLVRLDMVRLAGIPCLHHGKEERPPLNFVRKVVSITPKTAQAEDGVTPVEINVEFEGGGPWSGVIKVATTPFDRDAHQRALDDRLAEGDKL